MSATEEYNENELLKSVATGNQQAFRKLMHIYQPLLLTFVTRLTKSTYAAEEIVQDVFLKIWINREVLHGVQHFKGYLFILCRNYAIDQIRKLAREKELANRWGNEPSNYYGHAEPDTDNIFFTLLDEAIDKLPAQQKKVYLMARGEGLTHAEIAKKTGLSRLTVKKYMKLAIAAISHFIRNQLPFIATPIIILAVYA